MNDAAFDPEGRLFYALLAPPPSAHKVVFSLCSMHVDLGTTSCRDISYLTNIKNMDWDVKVQSLVGVVEIINETDPTNSPEQFGRFDPHKMVFQPLNTHETSPYRSRGYTQINQGYMPRACRNYFMGAFKQNLKTRSASLFIVATDADSGRINMQLQRPGAGYAANFVDMQWLPTV